MALKDTIHRVIGRLTPNNEANTIDRIIFPILKDLGWDVNHELDSLPEVEREWVVGKKQKGGGQRADIALLNNEDEAQGLLCLIEAKSPTQKLDAHTDQLVMQAFHGGARICVLTNGKHWQVYLPFERGSISERRLPVIDLDVDPEKSAYELERLLSRTALLDGSAEKYAKEKLGEGTTYTEELILPRREAVLSDNSEKASREVTGNFKQLFHYIDEPQLIEKPGPTSSKEDVKRYESNEQVGEAADSILGRCEHIEFESEDLSDDFISIEYQFFKAYSFAQKIWSESNQINDDRFDADQENEELGSYFSYSHFQNTNGRFEALLAAERLFNEIVDILKAELGSTFFIYYSGYMYNLMKIISYWSGKQDSDGFIATRTTVKELLNDSLVSDLFEEVRADFAETPDKFKTQTPLRASNTDPLIFEFLGKEYRAKSKVAIVRDLLSLVHQQPPEGLQELEGQSISKFLSSDENEFNTPEQIGNSRYYFEKDWYAFDQVGWLYEVLNELGYENDGLIINYPQDMRGVGDFFRPEYTDYELDFSQKGKLLGTDSISKKQLIVEYPSPKPISFTLMGETWQVKSHTDVARTALREMLRLFPYNFHRFEHSHSNKADFISKDPEDLFKASKIPNTGYYLDSAIFSTPKNPKRLDLIFTRMMSVFGYTLDDYSVSWRWHIKKSDVEEIASY